MPNLVNLYGNIIFEFKDHFKNTLNKFGVTRLKHLTHDGKKKFFNMLKSTWQIKKK